MSRVYFIKPVGMDGPVKIGCSVSPNNRRSTLATWSPFALEIVADIEGGFELEKRFHALFAETHQRREWFGWSRRLAAVILAINDKSFDVATLPAPLNIVARDRAKTRSGPPKWTPEKRFQVSYYSRMRALSKRGMPQIEGRPSGYISDWSMEQYGYKNDVHGFIRHCEDWADRMTAQYGHSKMPPVRWQGPRPTDTERLAS